MRPAYTINGGAFELGTNSNFQQNGSIFNNSSNVQTINSNLTSLAYNFYLRAGTVAFGGTNSFANVDIQGGATMIVTGATTTDVGNNGGTYAGAPIIGDGGGGAGTLTVAATGTLNVNGAPDNGPSMLIGQSGAAGTLNLNGGAINVNARTAVALGNSNGIGTLNINSGTMTVAAGSAFTFGANGGGNTQTLNLNGGTLATGRAFVTGNSGTDNLVLNGGTLQALAAQTNWIASGITVTAANASTSTIDANSFAVTIASNIGGTGGLRITDSSTAMTGVVTLSGTNTYGGATTVSAGTLQMGSASALPAAALAGGAGLVINTGGTLNLGGNSVTFSALPSGSGGAITSSSGTPTVTFNGGGTPAQTLGGTLGGTLGLTVNGGTLTANLTNTYTGATAITGGTLTLTKAGAAPDPNNSYLTTGGTLAGTSGFTIGGGGTLVLGASNSVGSGPATSGTGGGGTGVTLAGGMLTLASGVTQGQGANVVGGANNGSQFDVPGLGNLTLTAASVVRFAGASGTVVFNGLTLNGNALSIAGTNFATRTGSSTDGTKDRFIVETDAAAPSLVGVTFANYGNSAATVINLGDGFYEIIPAAVPEPSAWAVCVFGVGALGVFGRRRWIGALQARRAV